MSDASTARQIALRKRPDLEVHPHHYAHERCWVVKDPVTLNYFHLRDEEHAILQMLDGRTSLAEIKRRFEETFAPLQLSFDQLHVFLGGLYRNGLVLADVPGQAEQLLSRREQRGRRMEKRRCGKVDLVFCQSVFGAGIKTEQNDAAV